MPTAPALVGMLRVPFDPSWPEYSRVVEGGAVLPPPTNAPALTAAAGRGDGDPPAFGGMLPPVFLPSDPTWRESCHCPFEAQ